MQSKNSGEKIYHIYARGKCIHHCLSEEEFKEVWEQLSHLADLLSKKSDLSYEELTLDKKIVSESSY